VIINTENPLITYSEKGKPFKYDRLFYATLEPYILEFRNCKLDKLTDDDVARCLARIFKKMEVNGVPVLEFFKPVLDKWAKLDQYTKTTRFAELIAKDIFCCFDKNRYDENGEFAVCDRLYCVVKDGEKDFIICDNTVKDGKFGKKHLSPEAQYFAELMRYFEEGKLPTEYDG